MTFRCFGIARVAAKNAAGCEPVVLHAIATLGDLANHSDIETTLGYTEVFAKERHDNVARLRSWVAASGSRGGSSCSKGPAAG